MNVKLTPAQKIKIINSDDVFIIMHKILLRENKIDRDKEHFWIIGLALNNKVLFIASECNTIIGEELQMCHTKYYPNAELVVIKNAGHTMFGEQPEECIRVIRQYLNEE